MKRYGLLALKIFLWAIASVIFLVLLVFVLIRVPAVQNFARKKVVAYVENKIKTKVEINKISLDLPKLLVLEDVYFEDQRRDTLLAGDTLKVDISLFKLLNNEVEINEIDLRGITANISRTNSGVFNFDYILKAFAGEQKKPASPADTTAPMKFSVSKINLDRIRATYVDAVAASNMGVFIGHFDTRIKDFDLEKMKFRIPAMQLSGLNLRMVQNKPAAVPEPETKDSIEATKPVYMDLTLGTIDVDRSKIYYQNDISAMKADVNITKLEAEADRIDMKNQRIDLKSIDLSNSNILFQLGKTEQAKVVAEEVSKEVEAQAENWRVFVNDVNLKENAIVFDNFNMPVQRRGLDYGHLNIKNLNLQAENLLYARDTISGNLTGGSFKDKSGFDLRALQTNFFYGPQLAQLQDLYLQTSNTVIKDNIRLTYPSIESITKNIGELGVEANLNRSRIGLRDVLMFMPALATTDPFKSIPNGSFNINGRVSGKVNNLYIPNLEISGLTNTRIRASGRITGLPDPKKSNFNVVLKEFSSGSRDLNMLVSKGMIPSNIRIPQAFRLYGNFRGSMTKFNTDLTLNSSFGSARALGGMSGNSFNGTVALFNFDAGRLLSQDSLLGRITASAKVNGSGLNPKTMRANFTANVTKIGLKGYTYQNLSAKGNIANQNVVATAAINDPNIKLNLDLSSNIKNTYPSVKLTMNIDSADLKALKLYSTDLLLRGKLVADMSSTDPDRLIGTVKASNLLVAAGTNRYQLDSVLIAANANGDQRELNLRSEFLSANLKGKYTLTEVGNAITNEVNKYFKIGNGQALPVKSPQEFTFAVHLLNRPVLQQLVPQLTRLDKADISGSFNSTTGTFNLEGAVPQLTYMGYALNNLRLKANTGNASLNYALNFDQLSSSSLQINQTALTGKAQNNKLDVNLNVKDKEGKDQYRLAGLFSVLGDQYQFNFNPNGLMLNYDAWAVSPNNSLQFGPQGLLAQSFGLSRAGQQLNITSNPQTLNAPLSVAFTNFKIETITAIAKRDSLLAGGVINGNAVVKDYSSNPVFTADLKVTDFNFMTDTVGNIDLQVNNSQANTYAANMHVTGRGNDLVLSGAYYIKAGSPGSFDLNMNINTLNLTSIQGFTFGNMKNASGSINGNLKITGTPSSPAIRGAVNFNQAAFTISMLNSAYRVNDDRISFTQQGIAFDDFTLLDSAGNEAVLNGKVLTTNYLDYRFAMTLRTDNFRALNSTKKDNDLFYGTVFLSSNLSVSGDLNKPVVDGRVKVNDNTFFTIVLPQNDPAVQEREGIVEFVDMDDSVALSAFKSLPDSLNKTAMRGLDVSMNVEVDSSAVFNIVIDEGNGDFVKVQGQAQLSAGIDPSGKISLTGNYTLAKGAYEMSYNFIKRRFDIQRGSTITWTGEPTEATLNVTAIYVANTAPLDLVDNQLGEATLAERNRYKQKLPFQVLLVLKGELLKPEITFDIDLPTGQNYLVARDVITVVDTKLDQLKTEPNELNKQVFSLLLLNRFTSENPFENKGAGNGGVETFVRQSVSRILTDQLNDLAGSLIQGVDLNFDLVSSEDYTSGEMRNRTDLNVGLSKQLLNDRLKVTVGSNFELEGSKQSSRSANTIAGNIALDYQLSKDGRYMLRAYRKNVTDAIIEGYVIETGIGFIISMDYNKFAELFAKKTEEDKMFKKEQREDRKRRKKEDRQDNKLAVTEDTNAK